MSVNLTSLSPNARHWVEGSLSIDKPSPNRILNSQEGKIDVRGKIISTKMEY